MSHLIIGGLIWNCPCVSFHGAYSTMVKRWKLDLDIYLMWVGESMFLLSGLMALYRGRAVTATLTPSH